MNLEDRIRKIKQLTKDNFTKSDLFQQNAFSKIDLILQPMFSLVIGACIFKKVVLEM